MCNKSQKDRQNHKKLNFAGIALVRKCPYFARIFTKMSPYEELATLAVTMKAGLGRSLHIVEATRYKSWMGTNSHLNLSSDKGEFDKAEHSKDLTKAAMGRSAAIVRFRTLMEENNC